MMLERDQEVILVCDLPEYHLCQGDVAILVDTVPTALNSEQHCILEIFEHLGEAPSVIKVPIAAVKPLRSLVNI